MSLISIVIPAYNEEKTISAIMEKISGLDFGLKNSFEVIIVDDGSSDNTVRLAKQSLSKVNGRLISNSVNMGKGAAVRAGFLNARGAVVIVQDADLEYDPADIFRCVAPILEGDADVVYGSRRLNGGKLKHSSWWYFAGGVVVTKVFNILYGYKLTDEPTCYKAFRKSTIDRIDIQGNGFEWEPEVTAKLARRGIPILEVPVSYEPRGFSDGKKISWRDGLKAIWVLISLRFR